MGMLLNSFISFGAPTFLPTDIAGLEAWWDYDDASSLTLAGSSITEIASQVDSTTADLVAVPSQVVPVTGTLNGLGAADFNGTTHSHGSRTNSVANFNFAANDFLCAYAFSTSATALMGLSAKGLGYHLRINQNSTAGDMTFFVNDGSGNQNITDASGVNDGNPHVVIIWRENDGISAGVDAIRMEVDGVEVASSPGNVGALGTLLDGTANHRFVLSGVAAAGSSVQREFDGLIGEACVYKTTMSDPDRADLTTYLMNKWGA